MVSRASVLILKTGQPDPLDFIVDKLAMEPSITLAWRRAFDVATGLHLLRGRDAAPGEDPETVAVVLLIGREAELPGAVDLIRRVRPYVHIVTLSLELGTATISIRDPDYSELARLISALIREDATQMPRAEGKLLNFGGRLPANILPARGSPDSAEGEPATDEGGADAKNPDVLDAGLSWVDVATQGVITIWSVRREETPGFARSWDALADWLAQLAGIAGAPANDAEAAYRRFCERLDNASPETTPFVRLAALLGHHALALKLFLIVVAGELDIRFHRMFGVLLADVGPRPPSVSLACAILAASTSGVSPAQIRIQLAALDQLRALGLIDGAGETIGAADEPLRVDPQLLDWLLTDNPTRLLKEAERAMLRPFPGEALALLPIQRRDAVIAAEARAVAGQADADAVVAVILTGSAPGWLCAEAAALAGAELRFGPASAGPSGDALRRALRNLVVAGRLTDRRLVVDLTAADASSDVVWTTLEPLLDSTGEAALVLTSDPARLLALTPNQDIVVARIAPPGVGDRAAAVRTALEACAEPDAELADRIAEQFPIALDRIPDAVALAISAAAAHSRPTAPEAVDWLAGFRAVAGARLPRLARRLEPRACPNAKEFSCLDPVILPETQKAQLRTIVKHVRLGRTVLEDWGFGELLDAKGVAALFTGESGTGKTMAAHAIASELATDLYAVDLSQIVSKYIGETEKNLDIVFDEAEQAGAVLLFDEADALFGKRSAVTSAHDRYANIEVSYLLQRMQQFRGLALLTSNLPDNMDAAFTRRLRFTVEFPRPNAQDRLRIWEQSLPPARRAPGLDLQPIAGALDVTGGIIRQMALHMAMLAAYDGVLIGRTQLVAGASGELVRLGAYADIPRLQAFYAGAVAARAA
jgi:hypothetical protein